jgi:transposase
MSTKEVNRIAILDRMEAKAITQKDAADMLGISVRQTRRIQKRYRQHGAAGLVHRSRQRVSNNKVSGQLIGKAMGLVRKHYHDFGPTLAHEKLAENHGITFSLERLRQAMIKEGFWKPKFRRKPRIHQMRARRACEGELVQLDGSPHDWFESRGGMGECTLLVYIDDATGKIKHLKFVESETTWAYFQATKEYLIKHGKPLAWYIDRHGVFRVNSSRGGMADISDSNGLTQFGRAMAQLLIETVFANTPQAKGRVERVNQTLQDRLVKELRLRGINTIEAANEYLKEFIKDFNRKFAVKPKRTTDAHRPLTSSDRLYDIFTKQTTRVLSKNLTCQYQNQLYQIQTKRPSYAMRNARVLVKEHLDRKVTIEYKNKRLDYTVLEYQPKSEILDSKQVNVRVDKIKRSTSVWRPPADHPWRQKFLIAAA